MLNAIAKEKNINLLTSAIINAAINVHKALGPGFTERIYADALEIEFDKKNLSFTKETSIPVTYQGKHLGNHRLDFLVETMIITELKAVNHINRFHVAQTLSYLKATDKPLALILNFARTKLEIKRIAYNL